MKKRKHRAAVGVLLGVLGVAGIYLARDLPFQIQERHREEVEEGIPHVEPASDEAEKAMGNIRAQPGFSLELFAAEPRLANPVCFYIDHRGRFYVAETFRIHAGVTDMRRHREWLVDDLANRTVADRLETMKRNLGEEFRSYSGVPDRIRLIEDRSQDGRADHDTVFADFRDTLTGIGAGLLVDRDSVYYTCIPDLWKLTDRSGDGRADEKIRLSTGYGVRFAFYGHDLHGLRKGPDGKIYFSIGDRGFHVESEGSVLAYPDEGAVLRCNPDGSELEVVHRGLRNPQELAFDDYGNLFTGDNNADGGDLARWVHVVEGGHSGWQVGYQWIREPVNLGPWNVERLWLPHFEGQAGYIVPPVTNIGAGPAGVTYYPGTGLPDRYQGHFFMCDFRGSPSSLIHAFTLRPRGASFEMVGRHDFLTGTLFTDVDFGPGAGLYFTDWVEGWGLTGKGRIYRVFDPAVEDDHRVLETRRLLGEGFQHRSSKELLRLLGHGDQRIRLEAQFELADRGAESLEGLMEVALQAERRLARLHALWALGQLGRTSSLHTPLFTQFLTDGDEEVRGQAAKLLGDLKVQSGEEELIQGLKDPSPRVRFFAAQSLSKLGSRRAIEPLVELLRENGDRDPYLRHAGALGLAGVQDPEALAAHARDPSTSVRMGVLLALRRMESPAVALFLEDPEPSLVVEASRAIYDVPIPEAFSALAAKANDPALQEWMRRAPLSEQVLSQWTNREALIGDGGSIRYFYPLMRRVLAANARLAGAEQAQTLTRVAASSGAYELIRLEAVELLAHWPKEIPLDPVLGLWRPLPERDARVAEKTVRSVVSELLTGGSDRVQTAAADLVAEYRIDEAASLLLSLVRDNEKNEDTRVAALKALGSLGGREYREALTASHRSGSAVLRSESYRELVRIDPSSALPILEPVLEEGSLLERQMVFQLLGKMEGPDARRLLSEWMGRLAQGKVEPPLQVELLEAAEESKDPEIRKKLQQYRASVAEEDPLGPYRPALQGGTSQSGARIFFQNEQVECVRCHAIGARGGGEAGPNLSGLSARADRESILESVVVPNRSITPGYENVTLLMQDGREHAGRVVTEDERWIFLEIQDPLDEDFWGTPADRVHSIVDTVSEGVQQGPQLRIPKAEVVERRRNLSSMPEGLGDSLTLRQLRDLVEFLAGL